MVDNIMEKKNKHLFFWIAFPIAWTIIFLLLLFINDLQNGPIVFLVLQIVILLAFFIVRVFFRDKKVWMRLIVWAVFITLTLTTLSFNKTPYVRKSAAYYKNPELIAEPLQLNEGKVQGFYNEDKKVWQLHRFTRRVITPDQEEVITQGDQFDTVLNVLPRNLYQDAFVSETMSYRELRQFIKEERMRGSSLLANYQIEQHKRLANPMGILIMTLLGVSVS